MAAAKRFSEKLLDAFKTLFRPLEGRALVAVSTVMFSCALGITTYCLWERYGEQILGQHRYRLAPEKMEVTGQPEWIKSDVKQNAVTFGGLENANLLDRELVLQVKQAFGVQPWVKRVVRVNKRFPSTVEVDLEYRRPLAMVEVPAGTFPQYDYEGLLPIDDEGCLLPVEVTKQEASEFPMISGVDSSPVAPPGNPWGDARVSEAAGIIALLEEIWHPLELHRVEVPERSAVDATPGKFVLITRKKRRFEWGSAPGQEQAGEDTAKEKVDRLRIFLEQRGTLDSMELSENDLGDLVGIRYARSAPASTTR